VSYPRLQINFLGTGTSSGVPMIACGCEVCKSADQKDKRFRSSIMVRSDTTTLVVDSTPDFRSQMLFAKVKTLDGIIFTHPHKDHIAGLDDVRAFNYFSKKSMPIFANELTQAAIIREFPYAFTENKFPGLPDISLHSIREEPFWVGDIPVIPIQVWHLRMPVLGFRFGDFTYITDANRIEESEKGKIKGSKVIVVNALRNEKHESHYSLTEAISLVEELEVPRAFFTHISHQLGKHEEVNATLPKGMSLAYDGLVLEL